MKKFFISILVFLMIAIGCFGIYLFIKSNNPFVVVISIFMGWLVLLPAAFWWIEFLVDLFNSEDDE